MKLMTVEMTHGTYVLDAEKLARMRAECYVASDIKAGDVLESERETEIQKEISYVLKDTFELLDWVGNNTNWEDVIPFVIRFVPVTFDNINLNVEWNNAQKKVIEE